MDKGFSKYFMAITQLFNQQKIQLKIKCEVLEKKPSKKHKHITD